MGDAVGFRQRDDPEPDPRPDIPRRSNEISKGASPRGERVAPAVVKAQQPAYGIFDENSDALQGVVQGFAAVGGGKMQGARDGARASGMNDGGACESGEEEEVAFKEAGETGIRRRE